MNQPSPASAAQALKDIADTQRRTAEFLGYRSAGLHVLVWGLVWLVGFGSAYLFPAAGPAVWLAGVATGAIASTVIGMHQGRGRDESVNRRVWFTVAVVLAFGVVVPSMLHLGPRQSSLFWVLLMMSNYMVIGLWQGARFAILGATIALAACVSYIVSGDTFDLWMALLGGGGLLLGGAWLRWRR